MTTVYAGAYRKLVICGMVPVTMWEHHEKLLLEGGDSGDRAVPKYQHGAERTAPLRHALVGYTGFKEWQLSCGASW